MNDEQFTEATAGMRGRKWLVFRVVDIDREGKEGYQGGNMPWPSFFQRVRNWVL